MKSVPPSPTLILLRCVIGLSVALIVLGATPILPAAVNGRGVQTAGLALLLVGAGEYLNHLPGRHRRARTAAGSASSGAADRPARSRAPCALGNVLDVLGIVAAFAAITILFIR